MVAAALVAAVAASTVTADDNASDVASRSYKALPRAPTSHRAVQFVKLIHAHSRRLHDSSKAFVKRLFGTKRRHQARSDRIKQQSRKFGKHISKRKFFVRLVKQ